MNVTVLSDPGPGYVLADKLNRARAFSLFLSSQAKTYLYNYILTLQNSHRLSTGNYFWSVLTPSCAQALYVRESVCLDQKPQQELYQRPDRMGTHVPGWESCSASACFISTDVAWQSQGLMIPRYARFRRPARERNTRILSKDYTSVWKCRHTSATELIWGMVAMAVQWHGHELC